MRAYPSAGHDQRMFSEFSNQIADVVDASAASVVQVQGYRRPATGVVYGPDLVLTTARAIGRAEHPRVRRPDGETFESEIAGSDATTRLALLRVPGLNGSTLARGAAPRVGQIAIALARSWSNALTATAGLVSVIGGPLPTGRRRAIDQVIRTSAPMHEGFAGGALVDADGHLLGIATAYSIRGLGVVIPAAIACDAGASMEHGGVKRGYLGIAAQTVSVPEKQKAAAGASEALLVMSVKDGTPAEQAGVLVGDLLLAIDDQKVASPDELLDLLAGDRVGRSVRLQILRGGSPIGVDVTVAGRR